MPPDPDPGKPLPYAPQTKQAARTLRRDATFPERLLWSRLRRRGLGVRFLRQRPIRRYVVDVYCPSRRLAIELDGRSHDGRSGADIRRQRQLEAEGITVLRFTNDDVLHDVDEVASRIHAWLKTPNSSLEGGGPPGPEGVRSKPNRPA